MMNLKKIIKCGLMATVVLFCITAVSPVLAADVSEDGTVNGYSYPIQPGSEEWAMLNHAERVDKCQLPEKVMRNMTTEELLIAVLDYPCFIDMAFYDSCQDGFEAVRDNFNGIQELLKREDAGSYLLNSYKKIDIMQTLNTADEDKKSKYTLRTLYLETLLAQPEIIEKMSEDELGEVEKLAEYNYNVQQNNLEKMISPVISGYYACLSEQQGVVLSDIPSTVTTPNGSK